MSLGAVAFFPWLNVPADLAIGPVRLFQFRRGVKPGNLAYASQADIDEILGAYATAPKAILRNAVLLEVDSWENGQDPDAAVERLFRARDVLTLAALAKRRLFAGPAMSYCCADNFELVIQPFLPGNAGRLSYNTRRRDGNTICSWSGDAYIFNKPKHVFDYSLDVDEQLLTWLMSEERPFLADSISEFNRANSDSAAVTEHDELVMMKAAFERLLKVPGPKKHDFKNRLMEAIAPQCASAPTPLIWEKRWPDAESIIDAWANEFCAVRGVSAHGNDRSRGEFVWSAKAHLAFASILFPLILKRIGQHEALFELTYVDSYLLGNLERFLSVDPFDKSHFVRSPTADHKPHPWSQIYNDAAFSELQLEVARTMNDWWKNESATSAG